MMYSFELIQPGVTPAYCSREDLIEAVRNAFREKQVEKVFAYNAAFDKRHLPELDGYAWYDIMKLAAYRQYNLQIPASMEFRANYQSGIEAPEREECGWKM